MLLESKTTTATSDRIREYVGQHRFEMTIAHEEVLSFLAHAVLVHGGDGDKAPNPEELGLWMLAANDYLADWRDDDSRPLTGKEQLIADLARISRFNNDPDRLATLARAYRLLQTPPPQRPLSDGQAWKDLQTEAFGCAWDEYAGSLLGPIVLISANWGIAEGLDGRAIVSRKQFFSQTRVEPQMFEQLFNHIGADRVTLVREINKRLRPDGLPHAPTALYHRPLVSVDADKFVAPLPWALDGQLRGGFWARLMAASKTRYGDDAGAKIWASAFGYLFEGWCQDVARFAQNSPKFRGKVLLPNVPGDEDLEDVVLVEGKRIVLFSVKSRFVAERLARHGLSRTELVDYFDDYFFGKAHGAFRDGALLLLSAKVDQIRSGNCAGLDRDAWVFPVLVTYDSFGSEFLQYERIDALCRERNVLRQYRVGPIAIASIDEYEKMMTACASGLSITGLLRDRIQRYRFRRIDEQLKDRWSKGPTSRLPEVERIYSELKAAMTAKLFGKTDSVG